MISSIFSSDMPFQMKMMYVFMLIPIIFLSLSLHETAHGYVAYKLGDPTARNLGRLTLNPFKHLDPIGTLSMFFIGFGWAKPVPVNSRYFKRPRLGMALTGAAGPVSNLLLGFLSALLLKATQFFLFPLITQSNYSLIWALFIFLDVSVTLNIALAVFNLIPVPPLDGSRILYVFLPPKLYFGIMRYERYIMLVMALLLIFGAFSNIIGIVTGFIKIGLYGLLGTIY